MKAHLNNLYYNPAFPTLIVFLIIILVNAILQPGFFSPSIIKSNLATLAPLILASMAQAVVLLVRGIDLSIGASITLASVTMASLMGDSVASVIFAVFCAVIVALIVGALNGFTIGYLKLPALISTFATSAICFGIALIIMPQPGGYVPPFFYRLYQQNVLYFIPVPLLVIAIALLIWGIIKRRALYRFIYAVGGNEEGAFASGIHPARVKLYAFLISGVFIALAAIVITAQTATGDANIGQSLTLTSIAAVIIGGVSLQGGRGNLIGAILGACILGLLINIIFYANISSLYQELIKGVIIIVALGVALSSSIKKKSLT